MFDFVFNLPQHDNDMFDDSIFFFSLVPFFFIRFNVYFSFYDLFVDDPHLIDAFGDPK